MPEYLSPGVYVEEVDAGPKPIEGVSTSTAGAVGVTVFGPTSGKPVLITSFSEFVRVFGGFLPEPPASIQNQWALDPGQGGTWWRFPLSVKGFFDNGGQRLYVKRVFSAASRAASGDLVQGLVSEVTSDTAKNATEIRLRHVLGLAVGNKIQLFRGNDFQIGGDFEVAKLDAASGRVTLKTQVPEELLVKRGDFAALRPRDPGKKTLTFRAKSRGLWGNALSVRVRPMVGATLAILPDLTIADPAFATKTQGVTAGGNPQTVVTVADVSGLADGDQILVNGKLYRVSALDAGAKTFEITPGLLAGQDWPDQTDVKRLRTDATEVVQSTTAGNPPKTTVEVKDIRDLANGDHILVDGQEYTVGNVDAPNKKLEVTPSLAQDWAAGTRIKRLRKANQAGGTKVNLRGAAGLYKGAVLELSNAAEKEVLTVDGVAGDTVTLSGALTKVYHEGHRARVIEAEVAARYTPVGEAAVEELFPGLRLANDGSLNALVPHVNARSKLVEVSEGPDFSAGDLAKFPTAAGGGWLALTQGDDRHDALTPDDFVGVDGGSGNRTGIQALEDIDEVSICLVPGVWASTVHSALIQHCELLKDRFAIIDPPDDLDIEGIRTFREPLDTKYAAVYYPWIEVRDPSLRREVDVGPSGHMAGIYARVDVERGVHKAPANEVIRGITRISDDVTHREQAMLNPRGINALRFFPGRGNRVWGARTLSSDASWKYVNVRRLFLFVEESIDEGTQFVVFEPNSDPTWARVRQTITNFLLTVWRSGALEGTKPDQAFFVRCDRTTMSQDDIDNGRLICVIGIAPVKPAEFVIFRIQQKTLESGAAT